MLWELRKSGRWMGRLVVLAMLFAFSGIASLASAGPAPGAAAPSHHSTHMEAADTGSACEHAGQHQAPAPASSPSPASSGDHGCHCVTPGLCALAVPTVAVGVEPVSRAGDPLMPALAAGASLALVSPPHKPPRA
ncbi:MAG: hypothetical protein Q7R40_19405 [Phaeospirillum sp.]|nr:hypothetical protein [Phaeospirillum sp.]